MFLYAEGRTHRYRDPCKRIVGLVAEERLPAEASAAMVQEYAHVRLRRGGPRSDALARASWLVRICHLHEVGVEDLVLALTLLEDHSWLHAQDAVYAATALNREIGAILTTDRDFERIPELERIDPLDADRIDDLLLA